MKKNIWIKVLFIAMLFVPIVLGNKAYAANLSSLAMVHTQLEKTFPKG